MDVRYDAGSVFPILIPIHPNADIGLTVEQAIALQSDLTLAIAEATLKQTIATKSRELAFAGFRPQDLILPSDESEIPTPAPE